MGRPLHVLAVEPFYGGSHRAFLDAVVSRSSHRWTLLTGKPVHWKWRSRSAPLEMAGRVAGLAESGDRPDVIFVSDMLDLPTWRGLTASRLWRDCPVVCYFHENQWTYPTSPSARVDHHFGYTNLLSAIVADVCWFNSAFHRDEFLEAGRAFIARMPDSRSLHDFAALRAKSTVVPPGFDPPANLRRRVGEGHHGPLNLGWVSRWEFDKCPERLLTLAGHLDRIGVDYRWVLAGPRSKTPHPALAQLRQRDADRIVFDQFASSKEQYWEALQTMDVVVSTADHEFFGIAICEAVWAGAAPVLPARLSYPDLFAHGSLYENLEHAAELIASLASHGVRSRSAELNRTKIAPLHMSEVASQIDRRLSALVDEGLRSH